MRPNRMTTAWRLLSHFGPRWVAGRSIYALKRKAGWWEKRLPARPWNSFNLADLLVEPRFVDADVLLAHRLNHPARFFFSPADQTVFVGRLAAIDAAGRDASIAEADAFAAGRVRFFGDAAFDVGFPPAWHRHPETGREVSSDVHWSRLDDFEFGDIKLLWEPARFSFAFALVRAYWRTGDERYGELFWQAVESFRAANPPQLGVHWKCGQEISLRLMAWCFGLYGFVDAPATTPARVAQLIQMIAVSAARIEANLDYALSQANNHGVSEAAGLWTAGVLFPELRDAARWRTLGRVVLHSEARRLIYDDGSFSQHSTNYHRVMLHDYLWSMRLADLNGDPFDADVQARIARASDFLAALVDEQTGAAPNYGHNDGALVLPLTNCDFGDFRPVVQAARFLTAKTRSYEPGPWDEELLWLFGGEYDAAPIDRRAQADLAAPPGGYYALRTPTSFLFTRATRFRHRPSQADLLHVDLSWRGLPIAIDPGTYRYNAPPPWNNVLGGTAYHNTVSVDGADQMPRAGRFLWMPWAAGKLVANVAAASGKLRYWEGSHDGYAREPFAALHRRAVWRIADETFLVYDRLTSPREHEYRLHWLLADWPYDEDAARGAIALATPAGEFRVSLASDAPGAAMSVVCGDPASPRGWISRTYNSKRPAVSAALTARASDAAFWTLLTPLSCELHVECNQIRLAADDWQAKLQLSPKANVALPLFSGGELTLQAKERLEIYS